MKPDLLFCREGELRIFLAQRSKAIVDEIQKQDSDYILKVSEEDFCRYLASKYLLEPPELIEDELHVANQNEVDIDVSKDSMRLVFDRSRPAFVKGIEVIIAVPFTGDGQLFQYTPSMYSSFPRGVIEGQKVLLIHRQVDHNPEELKQAYTNEIKQIKKYLDWIKEDIISFNRTLESLIKKAVKNRKQKLLADQGLVNALGIPIKRRDNLPKTYTIPTLQRKPKIVRPKVTEEPFQPEPTLPEEEYAQILSIINNMTLVMERSPQTFTKLAEEEIRDHFLMHLNGHYEGQATGETFNSQGKTDILIRAEGKNLFIAECKFWKGEKAFFDTINQLLGYTSWRDTKTAILLFNKNKNFSSVLTQIPSVSKSHDCYKRDHDLKSTELDNETTYSSVFHQPDDENRELILTIMAFNIPK
jgi:hypothetical protein